ncbi:hypothetical protein [Bordetella sp. FB-8]|uniref:hypothetical protein n=1 Tax=Bordetella sp. FB-8 TaxID=1159870 RepID=UPI0003664C83|nr:hypothetical protein [Bordetella sp. FB-8]
MHRTFFKCAALVIAAAAAGTAAAGQLATVTLDAKAIAAGGIRTAALQQVKRAPQVSAYGLVLDPGPLITLSAQIAAARSKLAAAQATTALARSEAARAADLYRSQHNISQAAFQAAQSRLRVAEANQANVQAQLTGLDARARTDWGTKLATAASSGAAPLPQLGSGAQQLVEVSLPLGQSLPAVSTDPAASTPDGKRVSLRLVGRAPRAAAGVAGPSQYYLMFAQDSAPIGTPLTVALSGSGAVAGVLVPPSAMVWHDGTALVYRQTGAGSFAPIAVPTSSRVEGGYFVAVGDGTALQAGQRIVVAGAALLFSASQAPPTAAKAKPAKAENDDDN